MKLGKDLAKSIVDAQLIKADTLDNKATVFFMKMYGSPLVSGNRLTLSNVAGSFAGLADDLNESIYASSQTFLPERNRRAMIFIHGNKIFQDHLVIGSCESSMKAVAGGIANNFTFYNTHGNVVAIAKIISGETQITTMRNNRTQEIIVQNSNTLEMEKELTTWLIEHYFL